jgi:hypothetical protein
MLYKVVKKNEVVNFTDREIYYEHLNSFGFKECYFNYLDYDFLEYIYKFGKELQPNPLCFKNGDCNIYLLNYNDIINEQLPEDVYNNADEIILITDGYFIPKFNIPYQMKSIDFISDSIKHDKELGNFYKLKEYDTKNKLKYLDRIHNRHFRLIFKFHFETEKDIHINNKDVFYRIYKYNGKTNYTLFKDDKEFNYICDNEPLLNIQKDIKDCFKIPFGCEIFIGGYNFIR